MAKFQGFETFEVNVDDGFVCIRQMSHEFGKVVAVYIPFSHWPDVVADIDGAVTTARLLSGGK